MTTHYPELLHHLLERGEGPCVEFKEGNADPERIGKYISALSNMASCLGESEAYLVFGIRDEDRSFVGTDVDFDNMKVGETKVYNIGWWNGCGIAKRGINPEVVEFGNK